MYESMMDRVEARVLGLASYPLQSAATRYRLLQHVEPLRKKGFMLEASPFLDEHEFVSLYQDRQLARKVFCLWRPLLRRIRETIKITRFDLIFVQREAMFFGPAMFEWLYQKLGRCPLVLDLDDATYVRYTSPTFGKIGSFFKFFGKTDNLIKRADAVICGNRFIAEYVESKGTKAVVVPTVVDTDKFCPVEKNNDVPVIGWIGTHSTFPSLERLFPVLQALAARYDFVLKIVGSGRSQVNVEGLKIENLEWSLDREISDFQSLDIGLYPLETSGSASREWLVGKSGFKAVQYMSVGIPFVVTPIGVCAELGSEGKTHFAASTGEEWYAALERILRSPETQRRMGEAGRNYALRHFTVAQQTEKIAAVFREALENYSRKDKLVL